MATIGTVLTPVIGPGGNACPGLDWRAGSKCPYWLRVEQLGGTGRMAVGFNGAGPVSTICGGLGGYVTDPNGGGFDNIFHVDVWAAFRAGAWSSSVVVQLYGVRQPLTSTIWTVRTSCNPFSGGGPSLNVSPPSDPAWNTTCPSTVIATVTVTAAGGISIV